MHTMADLVRDQHPPIFPPHASVHEAARQMHARGVGAALVAADDARFVGIVSRGDFSGMERDRLDEETGLWERIA